MEALIRTAGKSIQQEQYTTAVQTLAPPLTDCDPQVSLLLSAALEASADISGAQETLRQAHQRWPQDARLAASLARIYFMSGHIPEAAEALSSTKITSSAPLQELELRTEINLALHHLAAAQSVAEIANRSYPSSATLLLLANVLQIQGRAPVAYSLLKVQRQGNADSVPFLITIAECEYDIGIFPSAYQDLQHAVTIDPKSFQAHYLLGNTLVKLAQVDDAIEQYRLAIDLAHDRPMPYYQLALAEVVKGETGEAKNELREAIRLDDRFGLAYNELGKLLIEENRFAEAVDPLEKAIDRNPSLESSYYFLMRAYSRLGDKKKSDEVLKVYLTVKASNRKRPAELNSQEQPHEPPPPTGKGKPELDK